MKAITALTLLKKHRFINQNMRLRDLRFLRRLFEAKTWEDFIRHIMITEYLVGKRDLTEEIRIPEANFAIGGTTKFEVKLKETEDAV